MATEIQLEQLQRWMQTFTVHRGSEEDALAAAAVEGIPADEVTSVILPSSTLTSLERLGVYRGMYLLRLAEALETDYPALAHFLGGEAFNEFVAGYVEAFPSRSYTLNRLGEHLPEHIRTAPGVARRGFLYDLARLELAVSEVFDAPESPVLTTEQIAQVPTEAWADTRLRPIEAFRLLSFQYPVNAYLTSVKEDDHDHPKARKKNARVAVFRRKYACWRLELSRPAYDLLQALAAGTPLGDAVAAARKRRGRAAVGEEQLFRWFRDWVREGIFQSVE